MSVIDVDLGAIEAIGSSLDLRAPNLEALKTIAFEVSQHFDVESGQPPFECVIDSATGMGKTFILAAAIEYYAVVEGVRDFAVITPGRTILEKTQTNFTPGHAKSLLGGMEVEPVVITSENFASPAMRTAMDDPERVKLYVFTVQSLLQPTSKAGRRTHKFQEGLGAAFYEQLATTQPLVVFADEHHTYYGDKFSKAVRGIKPWVLIGLTATPHPKTPIEQIIYRYPLAAAIAERYVKTPVIVGRKDGRTDPRTKLTDGVQLLEVKRQTIERYAREVGVEPLNPVMLVVAPSIEEANSYGEIFRDPDFFGGRYGDQVLVVHSDQPDEALKQLDRVEDPESGVSIIVSVGMLKEGWDVKNVYVIASMRASVSEILTEQTLGRGLRLPFGVYTDLEMLDTLEVLAHERYEELLRKAGVINEAFVDYRVRAVLRRTAEGGLVSVLEQEEAKRAFTVEAGGEDLGSVTPGTPAVTTVEERARTAAALAAAPPIELPPRPEYPPVSVPVLKVVTLGTRFSLADITELEPFRKAGRKLAVDPVGELRRTRISAKLEIGPDGIPTTRLVTGAAVDVVSSPGALLPLEAAKTAISRAVLNSEVVPSRRGEAAALAPILDAFLAGLGDQAAAVLGAYQDLAAGTLIRLIEEEQRRIVPKPQFDEVLDLVPLTRPRFSRPTVTEDLTGKFLKGAGYEGWHKSMHTQVWFDSSPERDVANIIDQAQEVAYWVRLLTGDLRILIHEGSHYNPDFVVVETDGTHWIVEVKSDKEMPTGQVQDKRTAALRWVNYVNKDEKATHPWKYLLVSETHVAQAKGSWAALKVLGE